MSISSLMSNFSNNDSNRFLLFILAVDLIFIGIHLAMKLEVIEMPGKFWLDWEGGYTEYFQYLKYIGIILCSVYLVLVRREPSFLPWAFLFFVLLLDDAFTFHERGGEFLVDYFGIQPQFGLRAVDFGELYYHALVGALFSIFIGIAFIKGSRNFKKICLDIFLLFTFFVLFGVIIDMVHSYFNHVDTLSDALVLIEDGGEMIALSLIVWYFYFVAKKHPEEGPFLISNTIEK